jgi:hypothetical protein
MEVNFMENALKKYVFRIVFTMFMLLIWLASCWAGDLVDENTLAYWKFDEGSGDVAEDSSDNVNNGDIEDAEWVDGISGTGLQFNGGSSRVVVPDSQTLHSNTGDITIEAWIKVASDPIGWGPGASGAGGIVFKQDAYQWVVHGELNGTLWFGIWGARLESTGAYLFSEHVGEWHHTVLTFEGAKQEAQIFVDGEMVAEGIVAEAVDQSAQVLYIGYKSDDNVYFHGVIDEVRISDVVRTEQEIQDMMNQMLAVRSAGKLWSLWGELKQTR